MPEINAHRYLTQDSSKKEDVQNQVEFSKAILLQQELTDNKYFNEGTAEPKTRNFQKKTKVESEIERFILKNQNIKISGWDYEDSANLVSDNEDLSNFVKSSLRKRRFKHKHNREIMKNK